MSAGARILGYAVAVYDYAATSTTQVTLKLNDRIAILSKNGQDKGWWKGENLRTKKVRTGFLLFSERCTGITAFVHLSVCVSRFCPDDIVNSSTFCNRSCFRVSFGKLRNMSPCMVSSLLLLDGHIKKCAHADINTHSHLNTPIHIHTHTYIQTETHSHTHTFTHTFSHTHSQTRAHVHTHMHMYTHTHTCTHTHSHSYTHTHTQTHTPRLKAKQHPPPRPQLF